MQTDTHTDYYNPLPHTKGTNIFGVCLKQVTCTCTCTVYVHYSPNKLTNSKANNALCVAVCTTIIITDIYWWWYKWFLKVWHTQLHHKVVNMMNLLILPLLRGLQKPENLLLSISVIKQENYIIKLIITCAILLYGDYIIIMTSWIFVSWIKYDKKCKVMVY